jgi:hypothetical protein
MFMIGAVTILHSTPFVLFLDVNQLFSIHGEKKNCYGLSGRATKADRPPGYSNGSATLNHGALNKGTTPTSPKFNIHMTPCSEKYGKDCMALLSKHIFFEGHPDSQQVRD